MQSELKPCAHCGGAAECDSRQAFRAMSSGKIRNRFAIYCTSCNSDMGFCYDDIESCNHDAAVDQTTAAWNTRASDAEITRLTEALRAAEERVGLLRDALGATESAIAEYYRYWTGGEMRGSYDGKPERNGLWQALHKARQALAGAKP